MKDYVKNVGKIYIYSDIWTFWKRMSSQLTSVKFCFLKQTLFWTSKIWSYIASQSSG